MKTKKENEKAEEVKKPEVVVAENATTEETEEQKFQRLLFKK